MKRVRALIITSHPGPSLAITGLATLLAAQAAPHGIGPVLTAPALLAGQVSIGWSNDACDAARDAAAGRTDKPLARGDISAAAVWTAAGAAAAAGLAMALAIGPVTGGLYALAIATGWAYNLGLKSSLASGAMYLLGFGLMPAYAASTLPGHPAPRWPITVAAALLGLGAHFANVLPDLRDDAATGVRGLPQRMGRLGSVLTLACSLTAGSLVLAWGPSGNALALSITVTCVGIAGAGAAAVLAVRRPDSDAAFRVTLVLALLDVVLLLVLAG